MCDKRSTVGPFGLELALEASLEVAPHGRPLVVEDAVPGRVAALAAADEHVLAMDALEAGRERLQRPAGALVQGVRLELDPPRAEPLERVLQQQQLRLDVRARVPRLTTQPRPADLEPPVLRSEREVARAAERLAVPRAQHRERHVEARGGSLQRVVEPGPEGRGLERRRDRHPAPDLRVGGRGEEPRLVLRRERLQHDEPALEPLRRALDHPGQPRSVDGSARLPSARRSARNSPSAPGWMIARTWSPARSSVEPTAISACPPRMTEMRRGVSGGGNCPPPLPA